MQTTQQANETRDLYRQKYEAQLKEWGAKVDECKARSAKLAAQAQLDMKPHLDTMNDKVEAAKAKLRDIADATDDKWEEVKNGAEEAWQDAKAAVEGAYDALKSRLKN